MDGTRFDLVSQWLGMQDRCRATRRGLAGGALAIALGRLSLEEAAAACKQDGAKCKKDNDCCSKKCKNDKCRCRSLKEPCTGTVGSGGNTCCGTLFCSTTNCSTEKRCCKGIGKSCGSNCDCCGTGTQCLNGACCLEEGENCLFVGTAGCCGGLICSKAHAYTCQPFQLPNL